MIISNHVSQEDLLELIAGENESEKTHAIGTHVHQCEECRAVLESLTAQSEIWNKASEMLGDQSDGDSISSSILGEEKTEAFSRRSDDSNSNDSWKYPIQDLLDTPNHPEMLGRIGGYEIEREIGRGGMGVVLKAHDSELNRPIAIKILAPHLAGHGGARRRFAQEAIAAAGVIHPNVIAVHCVNNEGKTPYIVMPYVSGPSLQSLVEQQGPLSEIEIVRIVLQISSGLAAAHSQGLVHRDIKPANILVEAGVNRALITDFGLARAEDDASLTRTGWLAGTPNYMSPEQTRGERPDQRSDLFSLGSLMYFLATGRLPFRSETPLGVLNRIQNDEPTQVRQVNNQISKTMADFINRLLQKKPGHRFQAAAQLHELLEKHLAYLHQPDISKPPKVSEDKAKGRLGVAKYLITGTVAIGLAVLGIIASGVLDWNADNDPVDKHQAALAGSDNSNVEGEVQHVSLDDGTKAFDRGLSFYNAKNYEAAIEAFEESVEFDELKSSSLYNLGCCWALQGNKEKAFDFLNQAVSTGYLDVEHCLSDDDLESLKEDERFKILAQRIDVNNDASELVSQAIEASKNRRYAEAIKLHHRALQLVPNHEKAVVNLGYALHMQGNLDEAFPWHQKAAKSKQFSALGNYNLGCVYAIRGQKDQAFLHLDKAINSGLARFLEVDTIENDDDLENIRGDERFQVALKTFRTSERRYQASAASRFNFGVE